MTVAELLDRVSSKELTEWMAFYDYEPFGFEGEFLGHAQISAILVNSNRRKGSRVMKTDEFMPKLRRSTDEDIEDTVSFVKMLNVAHGGKEKKRGSR